VTDGRDVVRERQRKAVRDSIQQLRDELLEARAGSLMGQPHDENDDSNGNGNDNDTGDNDGMECDDSSDFNDDMGCDDSMDHIDSDNSSVTLDDDYGNDHDDCNDCNDNNAGPREDQNPAVQQEASDYSCSNVGPSAD
jgi:hypothetical protein